MGNFFGLGIDSIQSIDDTITCLVFRPPERDKLLIQNLSFNKNYKLLNLHGTYALEISPMYKIYDKVLIYSHGNATDIFRMSSHLERLSNSLGITVICYDYPGYGLSTERPTEQGCYNALNNVINYCIKSFGKSNVILLGQSLGTGVVAHFAATHTWNNSIILISPYKSIPRVMLDAPVECSFARNTFGTLYKLKNITCPVKIFHGRSDDVISCNHSEYIYKNIPNKKYLPTYYENVGHSDIINIITTQDYLEVIID